MTEPTLSADDFLDLVIEERDSPDGAEFRDVLAILQHSLALRRPDARDRIVRMRDGYMASARTRRDADARSMANNGGDFSRQEQRAMADERRALMLNHILVEGEKALAVPDWAGPTPETACRPARTDPITALVLDRKIDHGHERAARVVAEIYEGAARNVMAKVKNPESLALGRAQGGMTWRDDTPAALAWKHGHWYLPWAEDLHRRAPRRDLPLCLAICVWGRSVRVTAREHHMADHTAVETLRRALNAFNGFRQHDPLPGEFEENDDV